MNFNKVILGGRLCADPQTKILPSGVTVCEIRLAVNHNWTTQGGEKKESVCFIDATAFQRTAEVIDQYFKKGAAILIEGRLEFQVWEAKDGGGKRSKHTVVINGFSFVGSKSDDQGGNDDDSREPERAPSRPTPQSRRAPARGEYPRPAGTEKPPADPPYGDEKVFEEADIPF